MNVATANEQGGLGLEVLLLSGAVGLLGLFAFLGALQLGRAWQLRRVQRRTVFGVPVVRSPSVGSHHPGGGEPPPDDPVAIDLRRPAQVTVPVGYRQPTNVTVLPGVPPSPAPVSAVPALSPQPRVPPPALPPVRLSVVLAHGAPVVRVTASQYRRHLAVLSVTKSLSGSTPVVTARWRRVGQRHRRAAGREVRHLLRSLFAAREMAVRLAAGEDAVRVRDQVAARHRLPPTAVWAVGTPRSAVEVAREAHARLAKEHWIRRA